MGKRRLKISDLYRLIRTDAERYGAEDISESNEVALFRGFKTIRDKQKFGENAMKIVGGEKVSYHEGDILVRVRKFVTTQGTTKKIRKNK